MACPGEGILTDLTRRLVDKSIKEVNYFRHFETHDREFKQDQKLLIRKLDKIQKDIEDAKRNNQYQIEGEVQDWIEEADSLIQNKAEIRPTRFDSWCPLRQYRQGKRFAQRTLTIKDHIKKCNFEIVARPPEILDMKYHASRDFIDFESRKTKFKQLVEALEDGNHHMIGLQGMGGTGKTTLATQVGKQVEESKAFEKVIFVVVSNPPDVNRIRGDIARQLGLRLKESEEANHSKLLWSRIYNNEKKLLIILDDVWEELNLIEIGIPSGLDHKNCYVLITTRHSKVCQAMRCRQIVRLHTLDDEDALRLFRFHATSDDDSSRNELEGLARDFLKECGGLPVAIVALAGALRNLHVGELNATLIALQNSKPFVDVDEDLVKVYNCLRLSYDNLHNEKAQKLFQLCSIFPEDYEFPINLIIRLGIGSGIFEEADDYCAARRQALAVKNKLIDSTLLQKVGEKECVKMHDLVREVAQWIAEEDIQVIKDSRTTLKTNKRFLFWSTNNFPDQFDGTKLEILLLWISGNVRGKDPNPFFARMSRLKILFLLGEYDRKVPPPSLLKSLISLKYIHTLILDGWELGDISILENLQSLATLEFKNCLVIELPKNIMELKKLRWLGLRKCEIQRKNPFEVIKRCSQLEELYFVENFNVNDWNTEDDKEIEHEIAQDISPPELQIFSITDYGFERFASDDNGLLKCFRSEHIRHLIPDAMFKYLLRSAENVLRPPQVFKEDLREKHENSKASAFSWAYGCCFLAPTKDTNIGVPNVTIEHQPISQGSCGSSKRMETLHTPECLMRHPLSLQNIKEMRLWGCSKLKSLFSVSIATTIMLEKLDIEYCEELKHIIINEAEDDDHLTCTSIFPNLQSLMVGGCNKLEFVFPSTLSGGLQKLKYINIWGAHELKYFFGKYNEEECVSTENENNEPHIHLPALEELVLKNVPNMISIDVKKYQQKCPSLQIVEAPKAPTKDSNIEVPNATVKLHTISHLWLLEIEEASELEQVFIHKQDDMQKMTMMDEVFPKLYEVTLRKLPMLVTICEGIDFQNVTRYSVNDCPKYQGINHIQEGPKDGDSENQATTNASPDFAKSSTEAMTTSVEEVALSFSKKETVKEMEAKDRTPLLLEKALEGSTTQPQLRSSSLNNYKETEKEGGRVVLDPASKLPAPTSSSFQIMEETLSEIQGKDSNRASGKQTSQTSVVKSHLRGTYLPELEDDHKTSESIMQLQQEGVATTKTTKASHKTNIPFHDNSIDAILKERAEEGSTSEDVVAATMVADSAPRNSWSVTSSVVSEVEGSKSGPSSLSSEKTEKEAVKIQTSQLSIDPTWTNSESIKDTKEHGHDEENRAEEYSHSRKQSTGPINNLPRKDSAPNAKETTKGIDENATTAYKSPMAIPFMRALAIKETGDHSSIQEAELEKPIKATLPQVIPSLYYLSQIVDAGTSFSKLEICEIFKLVELKHGETDLLAQALEQYPQLLLPRKHRTYRIIAWSYRVLVDILVMLATKTPNTITPLEKSTLEANLNEAIVLGFDKDWVEFVRAKVFGVDMSDV
ncbi:hypothetical protein K1719_042561 [Acacia pycnantha]|nr:hypothetical protein K1719_042561 [Acacia pycnantha]